MQEIYLELIESNPWQPRQGITPEDVADLAADIQSRKESRPETSGLLQLPAARLVDKEGVPLELTDLPRADELSNGDFTDWMDAQGVKAQLAYGHRRKAAFESLASLNIKDYDYIHLPVELVFFDDEEMATVAWSENAARKDLSAIEEAEAIHKMIEDFEWTQEQAAEKLNLARPTLANKLRLLRLPEEIREAQREGQLSERQGLALLPLYDLPEELYQEAEESYSKPSELVSKVLDGEADSEEIRYAVNNIYRHVSRDLDYADFPLDHEFDAGDEQIVSAACDNCPVRLRRGQEMRCPNEECLDRKNELWANLELAAAVEATGIPALVFTEEEEENRWNAYDGFSNYNQVGTHGATHARDIQCDKLRLKHGKHSNYVSPEGHNNVYLACHHGLEGECACQAAIRQQIIESDGEGQEAQQLRRQEQGEAREKRLSEKVVLPAAEALAGLFAENNEKAWGLLYTALETFADIPEFEGRDDLAIEELQLAVSIYVIRGDLPWDAKNDIAASKVKTFDFLQAGVGIEVESLKPDPDQSLWGRLEKIKGWIEGRAQEFPTIEALEGNLANLETLKEEWRELPVNGSGDLDFEEVCEALIGTVSRLAEARAEMEEEEFGDVSWLVGVPTDDINFKSHLEGASAGAVAYSLALIMGKDGNKTRQERLEGRLRALGWEE